MLSAGCIGADVIKDYVVLGLQVVALGLLVELTHVLALVGARCRLPAVLLGPPLVRHNLLLTTAHQCRPCTWFTDVR